MFFVDTLVSLFKMAGKSALGPEGLRSFPLWTVGTVPDEKDTEGIVWDVVYVDRTTFVYRTNNNNAVRKSLWQYFVVEHRGVGARAGVPTLWYISHVDEWMLLPLKGRPQDSVTT